jgi:hypothetical protein
MKHFFTALPGRLMRRCFHPLGVLGCLLAAVLPGPAARAQAPAWQSALALTGPGVYPIASTTGPGGFVFVVGSFNSTANFGPAQLTSAGTSDIFVAKWDPATRAFLWAQRAGGNASDEATGVAVQGANVYVTGSFSSPRADFGPVTFTNANTLTAGNTSDGFLTKLVDAGTTSTFGWTQHFGGGNIEFSNGVDAVGSSVYICGQFRSPTLAFGGTTLVCTGPDNAFVAKLVDAGATGSFVWAYRAGGTRTDGAEALAVAGPNVYVGGHFTSSTADFGALTLTNAGGGTSDGFVAKLTDAGPSAAFTWAVPVVGPADEWLRALKVSGPNVYVTGEFYSPAVTLGGTSLPNGAGSGSSSAFVAKLTDAGPTGSFVWGQAVGGSSRFLSLALNGASIYVAGLFAGTARFGATALSSNQGSNDVCVAKLTDAGSTGSFGWAQQAGSPFHDLAYALALTGTSVCLGGMVGIGPGPGAVTATFGTLSLANTVPMQGLGYMATITDNTLTATAGPRAALAFDLYPNPSRGAATVQVPAVPGATQATVRLHDALGRVVRTEELALPAAGLRHALALTGLPAGVYAVQVTAGAYAATRRLVVE